MSAESIGWGMALVFPILVTLIIIMAVGSQKEYIHGRIKRRNLPKLQRDRHIVAILLFLLSNTETYH